GRGCASRVNPDLRPEREVADRPSYRETGGSQTGRALKVRPFFQLTRPLQQVKIRLAAGSTLSHLPHPASAFLPIVSHLNSPDREMGAAMLRFLGSPRTFCDGVSRRNFLQIGAFGAGLTLADMLRAKSGLAAGAAV